MDRFKTPSVPQWIREISHPAYRNIFSYKLGNRNLWGTETLLGDWEGRYLLVAQDFYPSSYIEAGIQAGIANPYRHKDGIPTNSNLLKTLRHFNRIGSEVGNTECDFLYASACFLLRADGLIRGQNGLPDEQNILRLSAPVLTFTRENMPNLKYVVAMGGPAARALRIGGWGGLAASEGLRLFEVSHPARALSDAHRFSEWEPIFAAP